MSDQQQQGQMPEGQQGAPDADLLEGDLPEGDAFPRDYVAKLREEAKANRIRASEWESKVQGWGGEDRISNLIQGTTTPEGVMNLWFEAGRAFGKSQEEMQEFMFGGGKESQSPESEVDLDAPLTRRELEEKLQEYAQAIQMPLQQQQELHQASVAVRAVEETLQRLDISDDDEEWIRQRAFDYAPPGGDPREFDPGLLVAAIEKAHEDWKQLTERVGKKYLETKERGTEVPGALPSSGPTIQLSKEPQSVAEAAAMHRDILRRQNA